MNQRDIPVEKEKEKNETEKDEKDQSRSVSFPLPVSAHLPLPPQVHQRQAGPARLSSESPHNQNGQAAAAEWVPSLIGQGCHLRAAKIVG